MKIIPKSKELEFFYNNRNKMYINNLSSFILKGYLITNKNKFIYISVIQSAYYISAKYKDLKTRTWLKEIHGFDLKDDDDISLSEYKTIAFDFKQTDL